MPEAHVDDVREWAGLLGPVAGHAAADGEDAEPLGAEGPLRVVVEIQERVEPEGTEVKKSPRSAARLAAPLPGPAAGKVATSRPSSESVNAGT